MRENTFAVYPRGRRASSLRLAAAEAIASLSISKGGAD